mgnify:CR=1 FL=1
MDVTEILEGLNEAQRQAVCAPRGNQLVLAGAGSGKTRVLVHRIAWLVQTEGISPYGVLAVTFTNKAAREMRHRLESLLATQVRGMWVGTFHGLAHRLLKMHWMDAGLPENFQILDSDDQLRVVKRITRSLDLDEKQWPPKQAMWFINGEKDEGRRAAHSDDWGDPYHRTMLLVYREYEQYCNANGLVDFGELLLRSHELWLKKPEVLAHYQNRFQYMLVDEFQDTNTIQYAWLRVLSGGVVPVIAVGDDDQAIYGWRGAKVENIQQFNTDFKDVSTQRLEQNYRSTENILQAANAVISNNQGRLGKELWTDGEKGDPISLYAGYNELDEASFVVGRIQAMIEEDVAADDIAILYRSNAQSRVMEDGLMRCNIPYRVYGGQRFYERLEIKNALAYMRLLITETDDTSFERVVNTPTRGIGDKTVDNLRVYARDEGCSLWQAAVKAASGGIVNGRAANAIGQFVELIETLRRDTDGLPLHELAEHITHGSGLIDFHGNEKGEKGQARVENLQELVSACRSFDVEDEEGLPLAQFLDRAALDAGDNQADEYEPAVQLMTLHSAKGLEFEVVFMAGVEENLFPHKMSMEEPGRLEEERRLCYVGITRAMRLLHISYAECRRIHGSESFNAPSRFIRELPKECVQEVRLRSQVTKASSMAGSAPNYSDKPPIGMSLGQRVQHAKFGEGIILQFEGQGENARVQVNFDNLGSKWLVLHFAKLEAL